MIKTEQIAEHARFCKALAADFKQDGVSATGRDLHQIADHAEKLIPAQKAINEILVIMSGNEWSPDTLDYIKEALTQNGFTIKDLGD